jgi:hypothetical protein
MSSPHVTKISPNAPVIDQRKYPRYVVALPAILDDGGRRQAVTVIDISREGCRIRCPDATPSEKYFRLELHLAGATEALAIDLAVMRWARNGDIGVEFISLSPLHQERLRAVIRTCEEAAEQPEGTGNGPKSVPVKPVEEHS